MTRSDEVAAGTCASVLIDNTRAATIQASSRHITTADIAAIESTGLRAAGMQVGEVDLVSPQPLPDRRDPEPDDDDVEETEGEIESSPLSEEESEEESDDEDEYVAGPAPRASTAAQAAPAPTTTIARNTAADPAGPPSNDPNARYSTPYVNAWKGQYDFHHKGKGRWAAGLPPPEAMAQTGVKGPNEETWRASNTKKGR